MKNEAVYLPVENELVGVARPQGVFFHSLEFLAGFMTIPIFLVSQVGYARLNFYMSPPFNVLELFFFSMHM